MESNTAFLPPIRLAGSSRLGQAEDGIPYLTEYLDRATAATMKFINAVTMSMSIPDELRPPLEEINPDWAKRYNDDFDPDQWGYTVDGQDYVYGLPIENLEHYEWQAERSMQLVNDALTATYEIGDQIEALQKEVNGEIAALTSISTEKSTELQAQLKKCQGFGISQKAVDCLQSALSTVHSISKTGSTPAWAWVVGGLVVAGGAVYLATR